MLFSVYSGRDTKKLKADQSPLKGVNLGGWLVLEKWITPSLFKGLKAVDEYTLSKHASAALNGQLRKHRDTFITRADFNWLAEQGIQAVRLPVGYWVFGDEPPYTGSIDFVDKAFEWAEASGLKILLDLHGAPGSQNGWDHSGQAGQAGWHRSEANIIKTLQVVSRLADRYGKHPQLLGIELLNEPRSTVPPRILLRYYKAAYQIIRKKCGKKVWVVIHDGFRPQRWDRALTGPGYSNVYLDTHQYQVYKKQHKRLGLTGHLRLTLRKLPSELAQMRRHHPVIIGEWSAALDPRSLRRLNGDQAAAGLRSYGAAQLTAYAQAAAWFYWTYRTEDGGPWSYRDSVENGLLPMVA
jgi:glucan 1,3-beta-glucosidase